MQRVSPMPVYRKCKIKMFDADCETVLDKRCYPAYDKRNLERKEAMTMRNFAVKNFVEMTALAAVAAEIQAAVGFAAAVFMSAENNRFQTVSGRLPLLIDAGAHCLVEP